MEREKGAMSDTYVLFTESGQEQDVLHAVQTWLLRPDERIYCPTRVLVKRVRGRDTVVEQNLYPGYLFIDTDHPMDLLQRGKCSKGKILFHYTRLLLTDRELHPLSQQEQSLLRHLLGADDTCHMSKGYLEGDQVVLTEGPLIGMEGCIRSINRHKKTAKITTRILDRDVNVVVGLEIVKKLP